MHIRELQHIRLFKDISNTEINCDVEGTIRELEKGEVLFKEGHEATFFFLVLEGNLELYRIIKGEKVTINEFKVNETGGEVPLLGGTPHLAECRATVPTTIFCLDRAHFWNMMGNCRTIRERILHNNAERSSQLNLMSFQREKLISLGTMSAGLAHELNNPAAAARRAAQTLQKTLDLFDRDSSAILAKYIFREKPSPSDGYPFQEIESMRKIEGAELDMMSRSEQEDEMADWLEELNLEDSYEMASTLVDTGYTREAMEKFSQRLIPEEVPNFITWIYQESEIHRLADELAKSTIRISDVISAMKSYSYMDRAVEKKKTSLAEGIADTLTLLHFKMKKKNINLIRELADDTPEVPVFGSEINQVWTNLLDNAIDAVPQNGNIIVRTSAYEDGGDLYARVDVEDDGHGIPADVRPNIFDPFYTTKEVGKGTGLGLDISYRIVVSRHKGHLEVNSEPGKTVFSVYLPANAEMKDKNPSTTQEKK